MFKKQQNSIIELTFVVILLMLFFYVLVVWASLLIPFIIAVLFSFAIIWLSNFYKKFRVGSVISYLFAIGTYIFCFWLIWRMIGSNVNDLVELLPQYQTKVLTIVSNLFETLKIPQPTSINQVISEINLQAIFTSVVGGVTTIFSKTGIILFYVLFILLESRHFKEKLPLMFTDDGKRSQIVWIFEKIKKDIKSYFVIKTLVSSVTAVLSFCVMIVFGLDFAIFWAFLIFFLNFIPSVWSIMAVSFPILLTLIQFESYYPFVLISSGLIGIQILMWNIIEPRFMGNKLNLSPLVIIIALGFWGTIWWVVGMLLSVPIMVIINIILSKFPSTRSIAILLSEKGELQVDNEEEVMKNRKQLFNSVKSKLSKKPKSKKLHLKK
jgi:AI-2 transport protein TqsA